MPPPLRYPSDLSDEEWAFLEPLLSSPEKAWLSAEVAAETHGGRRLLPPAPGLLVADAPA